MQEIENFMLAHPTIMSVGTERLLRVSWHLLVACGCLFCGFNWFRKWPSWSLLSGKLLRLSFIVVSVVMILEAYGTWFRGEQDDFMYPSIQIPLSCFWFLLLAASMYVGFKCRNVTDEKPR